VDNGQNQNSKRRAFHRHSRREFVKKIVIAFLLLQAASALPQNRNGIVTGRILEADGTVAAGVLVGVAPAPTTGVPGAAVAAAVVTTQTDAAGRYRLENIPFGRYIMLAGPADLPTYYPGLRVPYGAAVFVVAADSTFSASDFTLARAGNATVTGRVTPAPGRVAAEFKAMRVAIISSGSPPQTLEAAVQADGSFQFSSVPPGPYITRVLAGTANEVDRPYPTHGLFVGDQDVNGVELEGPITVVGRVVVERGGKLPVSPAAMAAAANPADALTSVRIQARHTALGSAAATGPNAAPSTTAGFRSSGPALLFLLPGEYRISLAGLPPAASAKSMIYGNIDLLKEPLKLDSLRSSEIMLTVSLPAASPGVTVRGRLPGRHRPRPHHGCSAERRSLGCDRHYGGRRVADRP
jgi:hypothetical protein